MTKQQIRWAADHDWFISEATKSDGVTKGVTVRDDEEEDGQRTFFNYYNLRRWAGY